MSDLNQLTISGRLGGEPDLRFTTKGTAVVNFSVASTRSWKKGDDWEEQTTWFRVNAWAQLAENIAGTFAKGDPIIVVGRIETREWEDNSGEKRVAWEVTADTVGPNTRWATSSVERPERKQQSSTGSSRSDYGDEEPF